LAARRRKDHRLTKTLESKGLCDLRRPTKISSRYSAVHQQYDSESGRGPKLRAWRKEMARRLMTAGAVLLAIPALAFAHTTLKQSSPNAGSTVTASPHEVTLTLSDNVEPAFSRIEVTDAGGARVDDGKVAVSGNTMRIGVKPLAPGSYRVHWRAVSVDTHKTEGDFTFSVSSQ
jgi:copper resistance protein C